ncbi:hypothetical protein GGF46_000110 [Coemansia sp. RSA 552]|nr:hypothetical protein GGF46_000110 [Coemansia sp. RSA 552]
MESLGGKQIDRQALFGDSNHGNDEPEIDVQDVAAFEAMMESRMEVEESDAESNATDGNSGDGPSNNAPMFQMFAGAGPVKVATESTEPEYVVPERPAALLEESDSEEHWNRLSAAVVDTQTVLDTSKIPLPALQYPNRVMHIKVEPAKDQGEGEKRTAKTAGRERRRLRRLKKQEQRPAPYMRVLSPYTGGLLKGEMLADALRREELKELRAAKRSAQRGRRGSSGFRGRGRGIGARAY